MAALVHVICHSTCLEMPRIAQICTYYRTKFSGGGPQTPFQYNNRYRNWTQLHSIFFKVHYINYYKPQYPILRFYAAVTFCLFGFFLEKSLCAPPPPPNFSAPSYATGTFIAHKAKAQVHFCDHAQSIVLINPSSVAPSFWESFLLSSVKNLHFRLLVQNRLMDFRESW